MPWGPQWGRANPAYRAGLARAFIARNSIAISRRFGSLTHGGTAHLSAGQFLKDGHRVTAKHSLVLPEIAEPLGRKFAISNRMLDVLGRDSVAATEYPHPERGGPRRPVDGGHVAAGDPDGFGTGEECSYAAHLMGRLALKLSSSSVAPCKLLIPPLACALNRMRAPPRQTVGFLRWASPQPSWRDTPSWHFRLEGFMRT